MSDSIFTKIIRGQIPCYKIYEDELTFAFLDIDPNVPGHILVVPKKQIAYVWDLEDEDYKALMISVKKVAKRIKEVLKPKWVGMKVEGIAVQHAHVHVFPFNSLEEYHQESSPGNTADPQELAKMAQQLAISS